ncbi:POK6 protein, partial [Upupa epops]|nr:POK6 protein [Upupa epops]
KHHLLQCFPVMGVPKEIKTDNSLGYQAASFDRFCQQWRVRHTFGIPYNSTGLAIVEYAHST